MIVSRLRLSAPSARAGVLAATLLGVALPTPLSGQEPIAPVDTLVAGVLDVALWETVWRHGLPDRLRLESEVVEVRPGGNKARRTGRRWNSQILDRLLGLTRERRLEAELCDRECAPRRAREMVVRFSEPRAEGDHFRLHVQSDYQHREGAGEISDDEIVVERTNGYHRIAEVQPLTVTDYSDGGRAPAPRGDRIAPWDLGETAGILAGALLSTVRRLGRLPDLALRTRRIRPSTGPEPFPAVDAERWDRRMLESVTAYAIQQGLSVALCDTLCGPKSDEERSLAFSAPDSVAPGRVALVVEIRDRGGLYNWQVTLERQTPGVWSEVDRRFLVVRDFEFRD